MAEDLVDPAAADLLAKLQSLGYVSAGGSNAESVTARNNAGVALLAEGRYEEAEAEFLAGPDYSIADIALYAYTHVAHEGGFDLAGYPLVRMAHQRDDCRIIWSNIPQFRFREVGVNA